MKYFFACLFFFNTALLIGQSADDSVYPQRELGIEAQWYPAGAIFGLRYEIISLPGHAINARIGYNVADRKDWGVQDNETGAGPGFSIGYRYYLMNVIEGLFVGGRADMWWLDIDWRDDIDGQPSITGTSEITVFQPTIEVGYRATFFNDKISLAPALALGREINIKTKGAEVGQGGIVLLGFSAGYIF